MTPRQFLSILLARRQLIAALFCAVVVAAMGVTLAMPKAYTASAAVVLDVKSPDPIAGMILPALMQPGYMATQLDLIRSERVVRGVIAQLNLMANSDLKDLWLETTHGEPGTFEPWLTDVLLKSFDAKPSKESNVINISYTARSPQRAADMANAFVDSYIKTTVELRVEPAKQYAALFDEQAKEARERLEQAQQKLSDYQRSVGLLATDERLDIENARLSELSSQLVAIQALKAESGSRQAQAKGQAERTPDALTSPIIANLNTELSRQESKLKEMLASLGEAHPLVQQQRAAIEEMRARASLETSKVGASLSMVNSVNADREAQVRAALDQQRQKVLALRAQKDNASVLNKEVDAAQDAYNRVLARREQTMLESHSTQTNVAVVRRASRPYEPSSPKLLLNLALAVAVGLVVAVGSALCLELWDRRLLSGDDVTESLALPLLGVMLRSPGEGGRDLPLGNYGPNRVLGAGPAAPQLSAPQG